MCHGDEDVIVVDIGIGELTIQKDDGDVKYKFNMSRKTRNTIKSAILNDESPLLTCVEKSVVHKIERTYRDVIL